MVNVENKTDKRLRRFSDVHIVEFCCYSFTPDSFVFNIDDGYHYQVFVINGLASNRGLLL